MSWVAQIELAQVEAWAVEAAVDLQKRANAAIKSLETERAKLADDRAKLQAIGPTIEQGAVSAMRETLREQAGQIKYAMKIEVSGIFAESLRDIQAGAGHVRKNVKETSWLMIGLVLAGGLVIGFLFAYWPLKSSQNTMQEQLNRIQQTLDAQQSPGSVPAATDTHTPDHHKGKRSRHRAHGPSPRQAMDLMFPKTTTLRELRAKSRVFSP